MAQQRGASPAACRTAYPSRHPPARAISAWKTNVSKDGSFKLGFDWSSNSFGIWFTNSMCDTFPVWEPDKNYSIMDPQSASLTLLEDGTLQLLNDDSLLWSTHYVKKTSISVVLVLLEVGNLVIRDEENDSMVLWQSVDYPTDTILPGGGLGFNKFTGKNISLLHLSLILL
uniref:non-specific serine/threonine protein kinase n=1 Tax=Oryza punctata TaxID=4537 RepID=A0A0E0JFQ9_ORYPU